MTRPTLAPCSPLQQRFLTVDADIIVYGGAAGSAKTYGGILRHLRYIHDPDYVGYVVRRNETMLRQSGGAFEEAVKMSKIICPRGLKYTTKPMKIVFPSGATINFTGYEDDKAGDKFQGIQISACMFDEGTQAKEEHIWWLTSRLRSQAKMNGCIWITCNPDPDSYLFKWVEWYLYPKGHEFEGRPDPVKNGKIRYFVRLGNTIHWGDSENELIEKWSGHTYDTLQPKKFCFLGGTCLDNPPLLKSNPQYLSTLQSGTRIQVERLLKGNWLAREESSGYFKREWLGELLDAPPTDTVRKVRSWDLAGSIKSETNPNPDWTVGTLISKDANGKYCIEDMVRFRARHGEVLDRIVEVAKMDGDDVTITIPKDAGAAGAVALAYHVDVLSQHGFTCKHTNTSKSKLKRFEPVSASMEVGNFTCVKGDWNEDMFSELEAFVGVSRSLKDDIVDSISDSYATLSKMRKIPEFNLPDLHIASRFN